MTGEAGGRAETPKMCPICSKSFGVITQEKLADALRHFIDEHPSSQELRGVLDDLKIRAECDECGRSFVADVGMSESGDRGLYRDAYCPCCCEAETEGLNIRSMLVVEVTAEEVVENEWEGRG